MSVSVMNRLIHCESVHLLIRFIPEIAVCLGILAFWSTLEVRTKESCHVGNTIFFLQREGKNNNIMP